MKLSSVVVGLFLVTAACRSQANEAPEAEPAPPPAAEAGAEASAESANASVTVEAAEVKTGNNGTAVVHFKPGPGFKWNLEYPARLTLTGTPSNVNLEKTTFMQLKGDFEASEKEAKVKIPVTAKSAGEETLTGEARFSVCNETTCLIEKANVQIAVKVTP